MGAPQAAGPAFVTAGAAFPGQFFSIENGSAWHINVGNSIYLIQNLIGSGGGNINGTGVFKSTDGGNTWAEKDPTHRPNSGIGTGIFDSANNQILFGLVTDTFPQSQQTVFLKTFSFATDTWGANFAPGGPSDCQTVVQQIFRRPNNNIWVLYDFGPTNPGGTTRLRANEWNGAAWTGEVDVGAAILPFLPSGNITVSSVAAAMDPATGNIGIAFNSNTGAVFMFQQILNNNTLGTSVHFAFTGLSNNQFGNLIIANGSYYLTAADSTNTSNFVLISPINVIAFTTVTPPAMTYTVGHVNGPGSIQFDGTGKLYWMASFFDPTFFTYAGFQLFVSTDNGNTWTIIQNNSTEPFFYDFSPGQSPQAPNTSPTFGSQPSIMALGIVNGNAVIYGYGDVTNSVSGIAQGYFLNSQSFGSPSPPAVSNVTLPGGGGDQVVRGGCKPLNEFDYCLLREVTKWNRIRPLPVCSVPEDLWTQLPWEPEWGSLPALAVPFRHIASVITPSAAAGDTTVSQLIVPQGYDGILAGIFWRYNGVNFIEGSGDIFWRVKINQRFVKDLSNVGFTLGSSVTPMPMTDGQQLQSRQRVSVVVNVPNLSGTIQVGTSTITGGLFGFYWPKGVPGWTSR